MPAAASSASPAVQVRRHDAIAEIILDRPPRNVLNIATFQALNQALEEAANGSRVVLIRSALVDTFSAGVDIREHAAPTLDEMLSQVRENARILLTMEPVTIAAIHGLTLGGGAELALLCDLVLASDDIDLRLPEIGLAAFPPIAAALLPERLPAAAAMRLLLGEAFDAEAASQIGLVSDVLPRGTVETVARARAQEIATNSGVALRALVAATRGSRAQALLERIDSAMAIYRRIIGPSHDAQEGIDAFAQKRAPAWSHR